MKKGHLLMLLKRHYVVLVVALCVGIVTAAPYVVYQHDASYRGVEMIGSDAEEHYVARMQEVYDGHPALGNVFLADKDQPYAAAGLGEVVVAWVGKVFGMNASQANVFSKFYSTILIVLLIYALVYSMIGVRLAAILSAVAPILGYNLVGKVGPWLALLHGKSVDGMFLVFARPVNPEISSSCLFGVLLLLYRGFYRGVMPRWWEIVGVGVLTGAALYISPYVFSFLALLLIVSLVWFLCRREWPLAWRMFTAGMAAVLTLVPFILNYFALHANPDYAALAMRTGLVAKHVFLLGWWIPILVIGTVLLWPKKLRASRTFMLAVFVALFLVINQHLVTGMYLHAGHYHWYITKPLVAVMVGVFAAFILQYLFKNARLRNAVLAVGIVILFYNGILWQHNSYVMAYPATVSTQAYAPLFSYLNGLEEEETILTDSKTALYIPMYTHHNTPNNLHVIYYLNPQTFYEDNLFLEYRLQGAVPGAALEKMSADRNNVSTQLFGMYLRESTGDHNAVPDETLLELEEKYKTFYARSYADVLHELGITMVVASTDDRSTYDSISALREAKVVGDFVVYSVK